MHQMFQTAVHIFLPGLPRPLQYEHETSPHIKQNWMRKINPSIFMKIH